MQPSDLDRNSLPTSAGVYLFKSKGEHILYIGKAKNIKKRLQQYFNPKSLWKQDMVNKAHYIQRLPTTTEEEALLLETDLIRKHTPTYNNLIKGDQSYVYIKIPHEDFPNIVLSRYKKNDKATYIGPKVWRKQLKQTLQVLRTVLKYRSCTSSVFAKGVVCSDYFFGLCAGRCAYAKTHEDSGEKNTSIGFTPIYTSAVAKERYAEIINTIELFFDGQPALLEDLIKTDIDQAVAKKHFERAAKLRDVYLHLNHISQQQTVALVSLKSGIFVDIITTEHWYVWGVLKLYQGKIIDVIMGKEDVSSSTPHDIYRMIELEYQHTLTLHERDTPGYYQASACTSRLTKAEREQLHQQLSTYIHGYIESSHGDHAAITDALLAQLEQRYHFRCFPRVIECTDISHLGGEYTVGAISAMQRGQLNKHQYRRFKITSTSDGDDYQALEEVITRRFSSKRAVPDVFVLDGGIGQLHIIKRLISQDSQRKDIYKQTTFIALGKGKARSRKGKLAGKQEYVSYFDTEMNIQVIPLIYDPADRILIQLRDEAHRFANTYRKNRMKQQYR